MANKVSVTITGANQTAQAFKEVQGGLAGLQRAGKEVAAALGVGLAAKEILGFAKNVLETQDQIGKLSQKAGVSTEALSGFAYAARLADVDMEGLAKGFKFLNQNIAEAQAGNQGAKDTFKALGVSITDTNGQLKPTEQVLLEVADRFSKAEDGAAKTALAVKLFGRAGMELIPFLNMGKAGIEELVAKAEQLGVVISSDAAKAAEEFNDNLKTMETSAEGLATAFLSGLIPSINQLGDALNDPKLEGNGLKSVLKELGDKTGKGGLGVLLSGGFAVNEMYLRGSHALNAPVASTNPFLQMFNSSKARAGAMGSREQTTMQLQELYRNRDRLMAELGFAGGQASGPVPLLSSHGTPGAVASHAYSLKQDKKNKLTLPGSGDSGTDDLKRTLQAQAKLREAAAQHEAEITKSAVDIQLSMLELESTQGLVSLDDYFKRRNELTLAGYDAEIKALGEKYRAEVDLISKLPAGPDQDRVKADAEKTLGELQKKETDRSQAEIHNTAEEYSARQQLRDFMLATEAEIQAAKDHTAAVAIDAIRREFEEKRKVFKAEGKSTGGLDALEQQRIAAANAEAEAQKIDAVYSHLDTEIGRINSLVSQRVLTETEGQTRINLLNSQAVDQLSGMTQAYAQLAQASGDPRLVQNAQRYGASLDQMGVKLNWVRDQAADALQSGFQDFFKAVITDAPNAATAVLNFGRAFVGMLGDIIAKMWAMWAVQKLLGFMLPGLGGIGAAPSMGSAPLSSFGNPGAGMMGVTPPMMAGGGSLAAGEPAIIGEKGWELWVPDHAGSVVPQSKLGGMSGGGGTVNNYYDNRGADVAAIQRLERMIQQSERRAVNTAVTVVNEQRMRS